MSVNEVDPSVLFGIGTWEQIKDQFLLASGDVYENASGEGESSHILTSDEMPSHTHTQKSCNTAGAHTHSRGTMDITGSFYKVYTYSDQVGASGAFTQSNYATAGGPQSHSSDDYKAVTYQFTASKNWSGSTSSAGGHTHTTTLNNTGSGTAHNNMPPYLAVNVWKRVA